MNRALAGCAARRPRRPPNGRRAADAAELFGGGTVAGLSVQDYASLVSRVGGLPSPVSPAGGRIPNACRRGRGADQARPAGGGRATGATR